MATVLPTDSSSAPHNQGSAISITPSEAHRGRVLCVDDDRVSRLILVEWLETKHYFVRQAASPSEADACLASDHFDIVISDIHMPGNNRLEWVESLIASGCGLPILLMTGSPILETACRAANLPIAGYLIKPPDWSALDARIQAEITACRGRLNVADLARDILSLLDTGAAAMPAGTDPALFQRLRALAQSTGRGDAMDGKSSSVDRRWRQAIVETIAVIEKTKHSFRSRELGQLRARLEQVLDADPNA